MPFKSKQKEKEYHKENYRKNKIKILKRNKKWRDNNQEWTKKYSQKNKEKQRTRVCKRRNELKFAIFALLGNKCANPNCLVIGGCSDPRCLQVDHINSGGNKKRRNIGPEQYYKTILEEIQNGSKDYQLLCANCNWIKRYENKELFRRN